MADAFISTSLMSNGGPSTSDLTGRSSHHAGHEYPEATLSSSMARAALCVSIRKDEPLMSPLAAAATTAADN
jgi:hypothetical protein